MSPIRNIEIRFATNNDALAIASLLHKSFAEYEPLYTPEGFAATAITAEQIVSRMNEGSVWVALSDGVMVGTASIVIKRESLYVRGMAVLPTARGQRLGESLLAEIEKVGRKKGLKRLFLSTTPFLDRAIRLYEGFGFRRTDEGPHDLFGTPLFTMEKVLGKAND